MAATVPDDLAEMVEPEKTRFSELASKAPSSDPAAEAVNDSVPETSDLHKTSAFREKRAERQVQTKSDVDWMPESETDVSSTHAVQSADEEGRDGFNGAESKEIANRTLAVVLLAIVLTAVALWLVAPSPKTPESANSSIVTPVPAEHTAAPKMMARETDDVLTDQAPRIYAAAPTVLPVPVGTEDSSHSLSGEQPSAASAVSPDGRITELLLLAKEALQDYRLIIPAGRNAYSYYQRVLSLDPRNVDALDGLQQIVERYVWLAGRSLQRQNEQRARLYIARGLRVQPGNARLLALKGRMNQRASNERPELRAAEARETPLPKEAKQPRNLFRKLQDFVF